jgi:hypothetical protein
MFCMFLFNFVNYLLLLSCYIFLLLCYVFLLLCYVFFVNLSIPIVINFPFCTFCVLFVCKCVLYCCHWVSTQLQLYIILCHMSYHISYFNVKPGGT